MSKKLSRDQKRKKKLEKREKEMKWCNRCGGYWKKNHNCRSEETRPPQWLTDEYKKLGLNI